MATITHATAATGTDSGDGKISKNAWNADHVIIDGIGGLTLLGSATNTNAADTTIVSTISMADVPSMSVTFTTPEARHVLVTIDGWMAIVSGYTPFHYIREGSTTLTAVGVGNGGENGYVPFFNGGNQEGRRFYSWIIMLTAGSHTLKWSLRTDGGGSGQVKVGPSYGDAVMKVYSLDGGSASAFLTPTVIRGLPTGPLLRSYTFDSTVESWTASAGTLTSTGGRLRLDHSAVAVALEPSGAANVADGEVSADFNWVSGTTVGLAFRATDASNYYAVVAQASTAFALYKYVAGTGTSLSSSSINLFTSEMASPVRLLVRFVGSAISVYANGALVIHETDTTYTTGRIGLRSNAAISELDNINVYGTPDLTTGNVVAAGGSATDDVDAAGSLYNFNNFH